MPKPFAGQQQGPGRRGKKLTWARDDRLVGLDDFTFASCEQGCVNAAFPGVHHDGQVFPIQ